MLFREAVFRGNRAAPGARGRSDLGEDFLAVVFSIRGGIASAPKWPGFRRRNEACPLRE
jgi:hypothetical protein